MSLITAIEDVKKEIGDERAKIVDEFRRLVDERQYKEAGLFFQQHQERQADLRNYAGIHLKQLTYSGV